MTTRIKQLPLSAGDIERQLNGQLFAVNGGRSNKSVADTEKAQLLWLTEVLQQFDRKELQDEIRYSDEHPKPANIIQQVQRGGLIGGQIAAIRKG